MLVVVALIMLVVAAGAALAYIDVRRHPRISAADRQAALAHQADLVRWNQAWDAAFYGDAEVDAAEAVRRADIAVRRREMPVDDPKPYGASLPKPPPDPDTVLAKKVAQRLRDGRTSTIPPRVRTKVAQQLQAMAPSAGQHQHDFCVGQRVPPPILVGWKYGYPVYGSPGNDPVVIDRTRLPVIGWGADGQPHYRTMDHALLEDSQAASVAQRLTYESPPGGSAEETAALYQARLLRQLQLPARENKAGDAQHKQHGEDVH